MIPTMTHSSLTTTTASEYAAYNGRDVSIVPAGDILSIFSGQLGQTLARLCGISEAQGTVCYPPGKWSIKQIIGHNAVINKMNRIAIIGLLLINLCASVAADQTRRGTASSRQPRRATKARSIGPIRKPTPVPPASSIATTTPTGLTYIVTRRGAGAPLKIGDTISIHYTGLLTSGEKFDSSLDRGAPFSFTLGSGQVIKGWDEGIAQLRVGDQATLIIPSSLGYGAKGAGGVIPPDATLIFIVDVLGVKESSSTATAPAR